jgi:hypothetical protein
MIRRLHVEIHHLLRLGFAERLPFALAQKYRGPSGIDLSMTTWVPGFE